MEIRGSERVSHPAAEVFAALRDKTPALADLMPNIERVDVLDQAEEGKTIRLVNRWQGAKTDLPKVLRPFAGQQMLTWNDYASWNAETLRCDWRIESAVAPRMFTCRGHTTLVAEGDGACIFCLEGELIVDPHHVPAVPLFVAKRLKAPLERFIVGAVSPNLTSIARAVQRYLDGMG